MKRNQLQALIVLGVLMVAGFIGLVVMGGVNAGKTSTAKMPDVLGSSLELAESDIERAGYTGRVEVVGGGMFGTFDDSNWEVCAQVPAPTEVISGEPRLTIERSCASPDGSQDQAPEDVNGTSIPDASGGAAGEANVTE